MSNKSDNHRLTAMQRRVAVLSVIGISAILVVVVTLVALIPPRADTEVAFNLPGGTSSGGDLVTPNNQGGQIQGQNNQNGSSNPPLDCPDLKGTFSLGQLGLLLTSSVAHAQTTSQSSQQSFTFTDDEKTYAINRIATILSQQRVNLSPNEIFTSATTLFNILQPQLLFSPEEVTTLQKNKVTFNHDAWKEFAYINLERLVRKQNRLILSTTVTAATQRHTADEIERDYFNQIAKNTTWLNRLRGEQGTYLDGVKPIDRFLKLYNKTPQDACISEIGIRSGLDMEKVHSILMANQKYTQAILGLGFKYIGISVIQDNVGTFHTTVDFLKITI